MTSKSLTF